jgi:hypothetical protein
MKELFMQQPDNIYLEKISSFWGKVASILFWGIGLLFAVLFFYQLNYGPVGDRPAPDWFYAMMFFIFLVIGLLVTNFNVLTIKATDFGITAGYGRFRYYIPWDNIMGSELDKGSQIRQYGGYGIRFGRRNGKSVLVYNTMSNPLVIIEVKKGKYRYFGFSTKHPDMVIDLIDRYKR